MKRGSYSKPSYTPTSQTTKPSSTYDAPTKSKPSTTTTPTTPASSFETSLSKAVTDGLSGKKPLKKYGAKLDSTSSPSRSRNTTKELILPPDDSLMCAPKFIKSLNDLTVNDGDMLTLSCTIEGDPDPQCEWTKDGQILNSSDVIDLKYKNKIATLSIKEVYPEDEGEYVCKATNSLGVAQTKCKLTVKSVPVASSQQKGSDKPPKIVDHLVSQYVKDGDPVVLQCRIIGSEKFDVVWLHNNKEIKPSKDFEYAHEANIYKLKINEIFPEDSGIYTCEAFNDAGESFSSCTLIVLGTLNNYHHSFTLT
ncbi:CAVP-target protein, putative, partial [Pediculus humanus corporis]